MPKPLTLYFAGSGHGASSGDDSVVEAYQETNGPAVLFPGPGSKDTTIHKKQVGMTFLSDARNRKTGWRQIGSSLKRSATGKGWHENTYHALKAIREYLEENLENKTVNIAGHSRGSITVIMLLNDVLHQHAPIEHQVLMSIQGPRSGKEEMVRRSESDYAEWYKKRVSSLWKSRCGLENETDGTDLLEAVAGFKDHVKFNIFLFDPVAGSSQGNTGRKLEMPDHPCIHRVRVLRMEGGGMMGGLSKNLPRFRGFQMMDGNHPVDLSLYNDREMLIIPLPGSHGAGLSHNQWKTHNQQYIGTSYMIGFLNEAGTDLDEGWTWNFGRELIMRDSYSALYESFKNVAPEGVRKEIHKHHSKTDGQWSYAGNAINAHHRYFLDHPRR